VPLKPQRRPCAFDCKASRRLRDECLNEIAFRALAHAREMVMEWRDDYNRRRPHSSHGEFTPAEFACRSNQVQSINELSL